MGTEATSENVRVLYNNRNSHTERHNRMCRVLPNR